MTAAADQTTLTDGARSWVLPWPAERIADAVRVAGWAAGIVPSVLPALLLRGGTVTTDADRAAARAELTAARRSVDPADPDSSEILAAVAAVVHDADGPLRRNTT